MLPFSQIYLLLLLLFYEFLPPGARRCDVTGRIEVRPDLVESALEVEEDLRTMREISKMADSICP